jgi:hypothetical protein
MSFATLADHIADRHRPRPAPRAVVGRKTLHENAVVRISVPQTCRSGVFDKSSPPVYFLQFPAIVKGGVVNLHILGSSPEDLYRYYGDSILAKCKIWLKELDDGMCYLNVDFYPILGDEAPTHDFFVLRDFGDSIKAQIPHPEDKWLTFNTPGHLKGAVVLVPVGAQKAVKEAETSPAAKLAPAPLNKDAELKSRYPTLKRMMEVDGWLFDREDRKAVHLYKGEGESRRTTKFTKPKKKH